MKVHRFVIAVLDFDGIGAKGLTQEFECAHYGNRCMSPNVVSVETADIGEWCEDSDWNRDATFKEAFAKAFPNPPK